MGQYHILVNLTKKQFVSPGGLGRGNKQVEHIDRMGTAMYLLTAVPICRGGGDMMPDDKDLLFIGSWLGDRIAIVGDYSQDSDLPSFPGFGNIYKQCSDQYDPLYDCYGMKKKSKDPNNVWRDITADLVIEMNESVGIEIIPSDHPTLWPDGVRKPDSMIESAKNVRQLMREKDV